MYHLLAGYKRASSSKLVLAPAQPATCGSGILRVNQVICGIFRAIPLEQGRGPDTLRGMIWSRPFRHFCDQAPSVAKGLQSEIDGAP